MSETNKLPEKWEVEAHSIITGDQYDAGYNQAKFDHAAELRAALAKDGGQPIQTAPHKGSFLIWIPGSKLWWPAYGMGSGFVVSNAHGQVNIPKDKDRYSPVATHWQPLPTPPTE